MSKKNIVLVGFMGSGKSVTAKRLAEIYNRKVISTDALIEEKEGWLITEIFNTEGEDHFRSIEKGIILEVSKEQEVIIDCGGGVVLDADNMAELKKNGQIFYLSARSEFIYNNIKDQAHRPLLMVEDPLAKITELIEGRKAYYEQSDFIIDANHESIDVIAQAIVKVVNGE